MTSTALAAPAVTPAAALTRPSGFVQLTTLAEAKEFARILCTSGLVPANYQGDDKVNAAIVAMQWGHEIGLAPLQALQSIAVINNRPGLWGDGFRALIISAPDLEDLEETNDGETATCTITRKGRRPVTRTFTLKMAQRAGLLEKRGAPWQTYPERMLGWKALSWAGRDAYADRLRGMDVADILNDIPADEAPISEPRAVVGHVVTPTTGGQVVTPIVEGTDARKAQLEQAKADHAVSEQIKAEKKAAGEAAVEKMRQAFTERPTSAEPAKADEPVLVVERNQTIENTGYIAAANGARELWEVYAIPSGRYITSSEELCAVATTCMGTDARLKLTYKMVRGKNGNALRALVAIEGEE